MVAGPGFRDRIDVIVETYDMQSDLKRERKVMVRISARRRKSNSATSSISSAGLCKQPQGLCGRAPVPEIREP